MDKRNLDINKIKNKKSTIISSEKALKDIIPFIEEEIWKYAMYYHIPYAEAERLFKEGKM